MDFKKTLTFVYGTGAADAHSGLTPGLLLYLSSATAIIYCTGLPNLIHVLIAFYTSYF